MPIELAAALWQQIHDQRDEMVFKAMFAGAKEVSFPEPALMVGGTNLPPNPYPVPPHVLLWPLVTPPVRD